MESRYIHPYPNDRSRLPLGSEANMGIPQELVCGLLQSEEHIVSLTLPSTEQLGDTHIEDIDMLT